MNSALLIANVRTAQESNAKSNPRRSALLTINAHSAQEKNIQHRNIFLYFILYMGIYRFILYNTLSISMNRTVYFCFVITLLLFPLLMVAVAIASVLGSGAAGSADSAWLCMHINCIFLLPDTSIYQLFSLVVCAIVCIVYLVFAMHTIQMRKYALWKMCVPIFLAYYCIYAQVWRAILVFAFFRNDIHWWMAIISRASIFMFTLHACLFFVISFWMITRSTEYNYTLMIFGAIISFSVAYLIPVDTHFLTEQLMHKTGYFEQLRIFIFIINVCTFINYLKYVIESRVRRTVWLQAGYVLHACTIHALFLPGSVITLTSATVALCGAAVCTLQYTRRHFAVCHE